MMELSTLEKKTFNDEMRLSNTPTKSDFFLEAPKTATTLENLTEYKTNSHFEYLTPS